MVLTVTTWLWGDKFDPDDVAKLVRGINRNLKQRHRIACVTDDPSKVPQGCEAWLIPEADRHLTQMKGCFARLRMFDPEWQRSHAVKEGDRLVGIDLDTIVTGPLDALFDRDEPFVIMQGANSANPCPMNGALQLLDAGAHPEVWSEFSLDRAHRIACHHFPDDQGWIWDRLPNAAAWKVGPAHGVYVYQKTGWPGGRAGIRLPEGARLVTFINRHPRDVAHLDWAKEYWR